MMHGAAGKAEQNWFANLSFNYLIFMSTACLSAFYNMLCQHTHYYYEKLLSTNIDPAQCTQLKEVGHQSQ